MSFSGEVKEELVKQYTSAEHCIYAELAALVFFGSRQRAEGYQENFLSEEGSTEIFLSTENDFIRQKAFTLCKKNINIEEDAKKGSLLFLKDFPKEKLKIDTETTLKEKCCKRAFLRGAYLCIGSMSDPEKGYHMEFDCIREDEAKLLQELIADFEIDAKIVTRKKYNVVYMKDGSAICDMLNIMGAYKSLMNFENQRIVKEVRNSVNRKVNCETANITKTVNAAGRQVQDILLIQETIGFSELPKHLREIAELRLEYEDATLQELGSYLTPPVGKSGVNHRLRKLSDIAEGLRKQ